MAWFKTRRLKGEITFGACTDVGRVRNENQDTYGTVDRANANGKDDRLFIVADGMGGYNRGGEASRQAVEIIGNTFSDNFSTSAATRLERGFELANDFVFNAAADSGKNERMGTTCTALALVGGSVLVAHVGDTRAYRVRNGRIEMLTVDHTLVEQLRQEGILTEEEARNHPQRNALTRAIGIEKEIEIEIIDAGQLRSADTFVLCTDGMAMVTDEEIRASVISVPPQDAAEKLVALANSRGGNDNITALVVNVK